MHALTPSDQEAVEWKIDIVRDDIAHNWAELAVKDLSPKQRKVIRAHLRMNIAELRLLEQFQPLPQKRNFFGQPIASCG